MSERRYTRDEVDAILGRALRSAQDEGLTHDELVAAAREVGVRPEVIARAAAEVEQERRLEQETKALRRRQVRGFFSHLTTYVVVCAMLVGVNLMTGGALWFPWVLFGWGIGLALHLRRVVSPDLERLQRRARSRQERELRRARKRELQQSARELGVAVTKGLATVAKAAAERIEVAAAEHEPPHLRVDPPAVRVANPAKGAARDLDEEADVRDEAPSPRRRST